MNPKVDWLKLRSFCQDMLQQAGVPSDDAHIIADCLVDADLCGVESHGVSRLKIYLERLNRGVVNKTGKPRIIQENPSSLALSAENLMGMVASADAMRRTIEKARETGSCFTTVQHSNHFGMASYFIQMATKADMIALVGTNAPPNIAPTGSSQPYLGTNPLGIGAPTNQDPVILDMAPSVVSMGKVILAAKLGKPIPEGWALTADGKPTTDAQAGAAGSVIPIGGPKGYGIAFFIEVLSGILSGANYGPHINNMWHDFVHPQNAGHFFCVIDISKLIDLTLFKTRLEGMIKEIKALPKAEGIAEIFVPGEIEMNKRKKQREHGIDMPMVVYRELQNLAQENKVGFDIDY